MDRKKFTPPIFILYFANFGPWDTNISRTLIFGFSQKVMNLGHLTVSRKLTKDRLTKQFIFGTEIEATSKNRLIIKELACWLIF